MSSLSGKVVVVGATGLVGQKVVEELLADSRCSEVRVLVRRPWERAHPKLKIEIRDYAGLEEAVAESPAEALFCCLGSTIKKAGSREAFAQVDRDYPAALARGAARVGVAEFSLLTALGADSTSSVFYNRTKGQAEELVQRFFPGRLRIFRPSLLLGDRQEFRLAEKIGMTLAPFMNALMQGPLRAYRPIEATTVARAMVRAWRTDSPKLTVYPSSEIEIIGSGNT